MPPELPDPLLRLPDERIAVPPGLSGDELLEAVFTQALDHVNLHAMRGRQPTRMATWCRLLTRMYCTN